jgi:hypothetical protein
LSPSPPVAQGHLNTWCCVLGSGEPTLSAVNGNVGRCCDTQFWLPLVMVGVDQTG